MENTNPNTFKTVKVGFVLSETTMKLLRKYKKIRKDRASPLEANPTLSFLADKIIKEGVMKELEKEGIDCSVF